MNLVDKYSPKTSGELIGNDDSIKSLKKFISDFKHSKQRSLLVYGPTGSGKTCSVYAIAKELGFDVIELNASDERNKNNIDLVIKEASRSRGLFNKPRVILVDDIDSFAGNDDRGGVNALLDAIAGSCCPVVMTARNETDNTKKLEKVSKKVYFDSRKRTDVVGFLKNVCDSEGIKYETGVLNQIAGRSEGDLRGSLNDLEVLKTNPNIKFDEMSEIGTREQERDINYCLGSVFKEKGFETINSFENVDKELDECLLWVADNITNEYNELKDIKNAYHYVSRADLFRARIKMQNWGFMYFQNLFMTAGVSISKTKPNPEAVKYSYPNKIRYLGMTRFSRVYLDSIASKIANFCHLSKKKAREQYIPLLKDIYTNGSSVSNLEFNEKEIEWLIG